MPQIQLNGQTFDVFIVRNQEAEPIPMLMDVVPRTPSTTVSVVATTTSKIVASQNTNRKGISIFNNSQASLSLSYQTPATTANAFMVMQPGALLFLDQQLVVTNTIYGIWTGANGAAQVTEYS